MGISSDGQLCYGICVEEDAQLPWDDDEIESWWAYTVKGYKDPFDLYDDAGNHIGEPTEKDISNYYQSYRDFLKDNPLPVDLVMHCSYSYPMYIIAVIGTEIRASRGYPERLSVENFRMKPEQVDAVLDFVKEYKIPTTGDIGWWLSSLYG